MFRWGSQARKGVDKAPLSFDAEEFERASLKCYHGGCTADMHCEEGWAAASGDARAWVGSRNVFARKEYWTVRLGRKVYILRANQTKDSRGVTLTVEFDNDLTNYLHTTCVGASDRPMEDIMKSCPCSVRDPVLKKQGSLSNIDMVTGLVLEELISTYEIIQEQEPAGRKSSSSFFFFSKLASFRQPPASREQDASADPENKDHAELEAQTSTGWWVYERIRSALRISTSSSGKGPKEPVPPEVKVVEDAKGIPEQEKVEPPKEDSVQLPYSDPNEGRSFCINIPERSAQCDPAELDISDISDTQDCTSSDDTSTTDCSPEAVASNVRNAEEEEKVADEQSKMKTSNGMGEELRNFPGTIKMETNNVGEEWKFPGTIKMETNIEHSNEMGEELRNFSSTRSKKTISKKKRKENIAVRMSSCKSLDLS